AVGSGDLSQRLAALPDTEQHKLLLDLVREHVSAVLGIPSSRSIRPGQALRDMGFDSLTAIELRNRLAMGTGLTLPSTLIFDYPTPGDLVAHLRTELAPSRSQMDAVLSELDRIESALVGAAPDDDSRTVITSRLRSLMTRWTNASSSSGEDERPAARETVALESASDDEVFEFIGKEFGIS
ncbi:phosphopantetheine-binding protein, partial [Streptomyces sp. URMC 129]|uniref:acyl carrier protein n=1 Tax=Streptomyces sp. URMC 129 TaxID=3423407 RepID=UPI003F1D85DC